jgi:nitroreductase
MRDKYIVLTSELSHWGTNDRHGCYIDTGIYAMNLLYALHYYRIGVCTLNCYFTPKQDKEMRKYLSLPESEIIILMLALGNVPESCYLAKSFRYTTKNIVTVI